MDNTNSEKTPTTKEQSETAPVSDDVQTLLNEYLGVPQDIQGLITDYLGSREKTRRRRKLKKKN